MRPIRQCTQCIYAYYNPRDLFPIRQCLLFGKKEIGRVLHDTAEQCRKDPKKCGPQGIHWFRKP